MIKLHQSFFDGLDKAEAERDDRKVIIEFEIAHCIRMASQTEGASKGDRLCCLVLRVLLLVIVEGLGDGCHEDVVEGDFVTIC